MSDDDLDRLVDDEDAGKDVPDIFIQVGAFGKSLSDYMRQSLEAFGFSFSEQYADDWAHILELKHEGVEKVIVACVNEEDLGRHSVHLIVSVPLLTRLFKTSAISNVSDRIAGDVRNVLNQSEDILELKET